jgi:tRNA (cytidine/uridine-2'-O-)-methyltransferase
MLKKYRHPHTRTATVDFRWPSDSLHVVLVAPEIPPNTGNIARLCAATGTVLHLVDPLGFRLTDSAVRRAGLDYWDQVQLVRHPDFSGLEQSLPGRRFFLYSCGAPALYTSPAYQAGDVLVFGCESKGLPESLLMAHPGRVLGIPLKPDSVRSLNLATAAGIVLYEALRQIDAAATPPGSAPP